jgi:hypothetical protein
MEFSQLIVTGLNKLYQLNLLPALFKQMKKMSARKVAFICLKDQHTIAGNQKDPIPHYISKLFYL